MSEPPAPQTETGRQDPGALERLGGWLFGRRTLLPLPIGVLLVLVPATDRQSPFWWWLGGLLVTSGELLRLWAVHHIGAISRTRSDRLGPLVAAGPFGFVRNPLYIGNIALWTGFALSARLLWLVPVVVLLLAIEYHAIVRWEERLLISRLGDAYRAYSARVPRWVPRFGTPAANGPAPAAFSWRQTLFSERGTLIAIAVGFGLLWLKTQL